ncbi:MAG: GtrA family protein [Treponema sp.]
MNKLTSFIKENWLKILKFGATGGLGTVTNLMLFFVFADKLSLPDIPVNISCFIIACTQNYFLNLLWTFRKQCEEKPTFRRWLQFMTSSVGGFLVNLGVYVFLTRSWEWPFKVIPQAIGILSGMVINYLFSNYLVFRKNR